jgi:hypothetical protein
MHTAQVEVGIGRRKTIQVRPADRREDERVGMGVDLTLQLVVFYFVSIHGNSAATARRRAFSKNSFTRS